MDPLTALLACSVYTADDALVRAIAQSNSHGNPLAVMDVSGSTESPAPGEPTTVEEATARLEHMLAQRRQPRLGLMQLPPAWVTMFGREVREAFDPCVNVSIGTAMLSAFDYECSAAVTPPVRTASRHPRHGTTKHAQLPADHRACVVRSYGASIGMPDFELVTKLELRAQRAGGDGVAGDAPVLVSTPPLRSWGSDVVLLPLARDAASFDWSTLIR